MRAAKKILKNSMVLTGLFFFASCATVHLPSVIIKKDGKNNFFGWKEAAGKALHDHPDILAARALVRSASADRNIAAGDYLPSVTGFLDKTRSDSAAGRPSDAVSIGFSADQNLFSGFETTGNVLRFQKDLAAAKWAYQETSAEVRFRLRSVYIELLKLEDLLRVHQQIVKRREQNAELIHLRYEAGREHLGSSLRANAFVEQAHFEVRQTERRVETQFLRFGRELGGDFDLPFQIEGKIETMIPIPSQEQPDYAKIAAETPQVKRALKTAEAAKANLRVAQSAFWPKADGFYDYGSGGPRFSDLKRETFLGLSLSMPFFNGGKNVQGMIKAQADYKFALESARSLRDETVIQLSEAWAAVVDAVERVSVQQSFVEASRKRSEIVRAQYSSGLSNFQEFDSAESDLSNSEKAYVESLADALIQEANWEFLKGSTLEDVIRENKS